MKQVLARKWRPQAFSEVIGQTATVRALSNALNQKQLHHAYLFTGTRGVGKTTIARIIAKCLNCESGITATPCNNCSNCNEISAGRFPDLYEIDAASRTKVEDTREILDNVQYAPVKGRCKIYLIDEVHMLSGHSFNALLKTLEEPPEHVKFLLATTDPQKLPATVLSRCLQFHLRSMHAEEIASHLTTVLEAEEIEFNTPALTLIGQAANGSMRDALSLLDQSIAFGNNTVNTPDVKSMLGSIDQSYIDTILTGLVNQDATAMIDASEQLTEQGADFSKVLDQIATSFYQISLCQQLPNSSDSNELQHFATALSADEVQLYYEIALRGKQQLNLAPSLKLGFDMTLLRMLAFTLNESEALPARSTPKTVASKATYKTDIKTTTKAQPAKDDNWLNLLNNLTLAGTTKALAQVCALETLGDDTLELTLKPTHKALYNDQHAKRLSEALSKYMNKPMRVNISIKETDKASAQEQLQTKQKQAKSHATDQILQDHNVNQILNKFDGSIIKDTIQKIDD